MVDADTILSVYGKARGLLMSTFNIIITCIIAERITESVARICEIFFLYKHPYFHVKNICLLLASVGCFRIFVGNNMAHPYWLTIGFYVYGLICCAVSMFYLMMFRSFWDGDDEKA